ncbi:MAG: YdbL family protein [Magnetococcus sp. WYHC-3]
MNRTRILPLLAIVALTLCATPALAMSFKEAKSAGMVVEQPDGYAAPAPGAPADLAGVIRETNDKRRAAYQQMAREQGVPLNVVETTMGNKLRAP